MKLNLQTDDVTYIQDMGDRVFYFYKSGGLARVGADGFVTVVYNTGDVVFYSKDGDEHRVTGIMTHDGVTWNETKTTRRPAG